MQLFLALPRHDAQALDLQQRLADLRAEQEALGARELLQEVLKEGNMSQREIAQNLLGKIGG